MIRTEFNMPTNASPKELVVAILNRQYHLFHNSGSRWLGGCMCTCCEEEFNTLGTRLTTMASLLNIIAAQ